MPTAVVPDRAAAMAALPVPHATSRTRDPAARSADSASCSETRTMRLATVAKLPLDQVICWRDLIARRSGCAVTVIGPPPGRHEGRSPGPAGGIPNKDGPAGRLPRATGPAPERRERAHPTRACPLSD